MYGGSACSRCPPTSRPSDRRAWSFLPSSRFAHDAVVLETAWYGRPTVALRRIVSLLGIVVVMAAALAGCGDSPHRNPAARAQTKAQTQQSTAPAASHGFNDDIRWLSLRDGLEQAATTGNPLMLVVHTSWCGRCKELKPVFHGAAVTELSQRFVMVNVDQDVVPESTAYGPDGTYVPRVMFLDPATGQVDESLKNPTRPRYHYYYQPGDDLEGMMRKALDRHGRS